MATRRWRRRGTALVLGAALAIPVGTAYAEDGAPEGLDAYGAAVMAADPSLFWRFEEDPDTAAVTDSSGHGRDAVATGKVTVEPGAAGTARAAEVTSIEGQELPVESLVFWFRTTSADVELMRSPEGARWRVYEGRLYANNLRDGMMSPARVDDGLWHMATMTPGNGDFARMYLDGALVEGSLSIPQNAGPFVMGPGAALDEIAAFDRVLTREEIRAMAVAGGIDPAPDAEFTAVPSKVTVSQTGPTMLSMVASAGVPGGRNDDQLLWDFGDGATLATRDLTGMPMAYASHIYAVPGTYTLTLRYASRGEVSEPFTRTVKVEPLVAANSFDDPFSRRYGLQRFGCSFGWEENRGAFDTEGVVNLTEPGRQVPVFCDRELTDLDGRIEFWVPTQRDDLARTGGGTAFDFIAHDSDAGRYAARLLAKADGTTDLLLVRVLNGEETVLDRVALGASGTYHLRFAVAGVNGGTSLKVKAWPLDADEPEAWSLSKVDMEPALAGQGRYGVAANLSDTSTAPDYVGIDNLSVSSTSPSAVFTAVPDGRAVTLDASTSIALAGRTITGYLWSLDGVQAEGPTVTHRFTSGTHPVTLTVTDSEGESSTLVKNVTVGASAPVAAFTSGVDGLTATFDASTSTATDDPIDTYTWDFGDGTTGTGAKPSHTYREPGVYPVTLTVDAAGLTGTVTHQVTVTEAALADTFSRTAANGWGTSSSGITWLTASDMRSTQAVGGGVGTMTLDKPARLSTARADGLVLGNVDATVDVVVNKVSAGRVHVSQELWRQVDSTGALTGLYRAKAVFYPDGSVEVSLVDERGGTETFIASTRAGFTYAPGDVARFRVRAVAGSDGTATLQAKVWKAGTSEPDWQATATPQRPKVGGGYALASYLTSGATAGGVRVSFDNLNVLRLAG